MGTRTRRPAALASGVACGVGVWVAVAVAVGDGVSVGVAVAVAVNVAVGNGVAVLMTGGGKVGASVGRGVACGTQAVRTNSNTKIRRIVRMITYGPDGIFY